MYVWKPLQMLSPYWGIKTSVNKNVLQNMGSTMPSINGDIYWTPEYFCFWCAQTDENIEFEFWYNSYNFVFHVHIK